MGLLIEHTAHAEGKPHWHELSFAIPAEDGEAYARLSLDDREAVYQVVLDAIRNLARG